MSLSFIGPTYALSTRKADVQRCVNLFPTLVESGTGKSPGYLQPVPGMAVFSTPTGALRGAKEAFGRAFFVAGNKLYELSSAGVATVRGTLSTSAGIVDFAYGLRQLVMVDGVRAYAFTLADNTFAEITASGIYGADRVGYSSGYFIFNRPGSAQYYISAIEDASTLDALDFASAEGAPDNLIAVVVHAREVWLFGATSVEVAFNSGAADFPFASNQSAFIEVGCCSPHVPQKIGNSIVWVSSSERGAGIVWMTNGYQPMRISTEPIEQMLGAATLAQAYAWTYMQGGNSFYCLHAPGLSTTLVYDVKVGQWHERAELVLGNYAAWRPTCHAYAFGKHLVGAADGKVYELSQSLHSNAGDPIVRDRISPHESLPDFNEQQFPLFELDVTSGEAAAGVDPQVSLRYSNDGGATWSSWIQRPIGKTGEYSKRVRWHRLGRARDRVWHVRSTDNASFSIIGANAPKLA